MAPEESKKEQLACLSYQLYASYDALVLTGEK
jgi:hypothetical protein